ALDGLLLRGVGDDDPALGLLFFLHALDEHAVVQRTDRHVTSLLRGDGRLRSEPVRVGRTRPLTSRDRFVGTRTRRVLIAVGNLKPRSSESTPGAHACESSHSP